MAYSGRWRVVESLDQLLAQINEAAPNRSKASDGSIADDLHSTTSDHYPKVVSGYGSTAIVRARDFTHDPGHGADMAVISEQLRLSRDRRIRYVIFDRRIFLDDDWTWRTYSGSNPHDKHMHVSVDTDMDSTRPWQIGDEMSVQDVIGGLDKPLPFRSEGVGEWARAAGWGDVSARALLEYIWSASTKSERMLVAVLGAIEGLDTAAILARIDEHAATEAQRDQAAASELAELRVLVERGLSGELDAAEVVRLIGERLSGQE